MKNNISTNSKIWLSLIGGVVAIIITFIDAVLINFLDPLKINPVNPDFAKFIYGISTLVFGLITIYIWIVFKWMVLTWWGYLRVQTTEESHLELKKLGIKIHSKNKIDLSSVNVELVRFSDLMIGKEHRLFVEKQDISSEIPLSINLFRGGENEVIIDFYNESIPMGKMLKKNDEWFGEQNEFVIKVFGKFENGKYEFTEFYKGNFIYVFSTSEEGTIYFDGKQYKAAQIRWEKGSEKFLKRPSEFREFIRNTKRIAPSKIMFTRNMVVLGVARFTRFVGFIFFKLKERFSSK